MQIYLQAATWFRAPNEKRGDQISFFHFIYLHFTSTDKDWKMAFGMASNLFQLNHNFLTHKCPSLSTKRHLFKHTEIYGPSEMIAYAPQDIFNPCLLLYGCALVKKDEV